LIEKRLSCIETLTKQILLTGCVAGVDLKTITGGGFINLKDKNGKLLGTPSADGARVGKWGIKGRCIKSPTINTLQIAYAKFNAAGGFAIDPLTKKPQSWAPLYKSDTPLGTNLCGEEILGGSGSDIEAEHLVSKPMDVDTKTPGCGDGILGDIFGGQTQLYKGTINCSSDKIAVSGGAECMPGAGAKNLFTDIAGSPKGTMVASRPATNGQGWYVECCLKKGGLLGIGGKMPAPQGFVVCLKKPEDE